LKPYEYIDNAKPEHGPLEKGVADYRAYVREIINDEIVVPERHPRQDEKEASHHEGIDDVNGSPKEPHGKGRIGFPPCPRVRPR